MMNFEELNINETLDGLSIDELADRSELLLLWFTQYDLQVKQYLRSQRIGGVFDKDITLLDEQAVQVAAKINEIRNKLSG